MFDGISVEFTERYSDEPAAVETLPWQFVLLLLCLATFSIAAAVLYPDVFGAPLEQF